MPKTPAAVRKPRTADQPEAPTSVGFTPAQLVTYLGVDLTIKTLANWRSSGYGPPFVKVGTSVLYRRASVDRWLDSMEKLGAAA